MILWGLRFLLFSILSQANSALLEQIITESHFKDCVERSFCSYVTTAVDEQQSIDRKGVYADVVDVCRSKHPTKIPTRYLADDLNIRILRFSFDGSENFKNCPYPAEAPPCCSEPNSPFSDLAAVADAAVESADTNCGYGKTYNSVSGECEGCAEDQSFLPNLNWQSRWIVVDRIQGRCLTCQEIYGPKSRMGNLGHCESEDFCRDDRVLFGEFCSVKECPVGYYRLKNGSCEAADMKAECQRCKDKISFIKKYVLPVKKLQALFPECSKERLKVSISSVKEQAIELLKTSMAACTGEKYKTNSEFRLCDEMTTVRLSQLMSCGKVESLDPYALDEETYKALRFPYIPELDKASE